MKTNYLLFKVFISIYNFLPGKKWICMLLKRFSKFSNSNIYKDLKFEAPFKVKLPNNTFFKLHHWNSSLENEIFWKGLGQTWEEETIPLWISLCENAKVILDIGANTGVYSIIAKSTNPSVDVFAFEPSDLIISKFKKNMKLNNIDVELIEKGVSNVSSELTFYDVEDQHQTSASLDPKKLKEFPDFKGKIREYKINTITIKDFIEEKKIVPDLVKIDVELHEPEVIEGFGKYLNDYKPNIIIEILTEDVAAKLTDLIDNKIFDIFQLGKDKQLSKVDRFTPEKCYNYLVTPKDFDFYAATL